jgi:hypothetical protein
VPEECFAVVPSASGMSQSLALCHQNRSTIACKILGRHSSSQCCRQKRHDGLSRQKTHDHMAWSVPQAVPVISIWKDQSVHYNLFERTRAVKLMIIHPNR